MKNFKFKMKQDEKNETVYNIYPIYERGKKIRYNVITMEVPNSLSDQEKTRRILDKVDSVFYVDFKNKTAVLTVKNGFMQGGQDLIQFA